MRGVTQSGYSKTSTNVAAPNPGLGRRVFTAAVSPGKPASDRRLVPRGNGSWYRPEWGANASFPARIKLGLGQAGSLGNRSKSRQGQAGGQETGNCPIFFLTRSTKHMEGLGFMAADQ